MRREAGRRPLALMLPHLTFPEPEDIDLYQICSLELLLENLDTDVRLHSCTLFLTPCSSLPVPYFLI